MVLSMVLHSQGKLIEIYHTYSRLVKSRDTIQEKKISNLNQNISLPKWNHNNFYVKKLYFQMVFQARH